MNKALTSFSSCTHFNPHEAFYLVQDYSSEIDNEESSESQFRRDRSDCSERSVSSFRYFASQDSFVEFEPLCDNSNIENSYLKSLIRELCIKSNQVHKLPEILRTLEEKGYFQNEKKSRPPNLNVNLPLDSHEGQIDSPLSQYYTVLEQIGSGSYGTITKIQNEIDKQIYALKTIRVNGEEAPFAFREIQALALINSPRVIRYFTAWIHNPQPPSIEKNKEVDLCIQMEYIPGQNLQDYLQTRQSIDFPYCLYIFHELALALKEIHSYGIVHRDFCPSNIILKNTGGICVIDFGISSIRRSNIAKNDDNDLPETHPDLSQVSSSLSKVRPLINLPIPIETVRSSPLLRDKTVPEIGTLPYVSPHQQKGGKSKTEDDVFSFGIITFELFNMFQTGMERALCINELKTKHLLPNSIVHNYPDIAKLVLNMTDPDAHKRPTAEDVSSSSIFEQLKKETSTK